MSRINVLSALFWTLAGVLLLSTYGMGQAFTAQDLPFVAQPASAGTTTNFYQTTATYDSVISLDVGYVEGDDVVISAGGTLVVIGVHVHAITATGNLKLQIYSSGTLVTGAAGATAITLGAVTDNWVDIGVNVAGLASGTYRVRAITDSQLQINALAGQAGKGHYTSGQTYSAWPLATDVVDSGTEGKTIRMRVGVK